MVLVPNFTFESFFEKCWKIMFFNFWHFRKNTIFQHFFGAMPGFLFFSIFHSFLERVTYCVFSLFQDSGTSVHSDRHRPN